jgi:hypothetical protein
VNSEFRETKDESRRFVRIGWSCVALGLVCFAVGAVQQVQLITVKANSARPTSPATNAVDGRPLTYWISNTHRTGRLDVKLRSPREIARVGLLNARNRYQKEHGSKSYSVQLYAGATLVTEVSGTFNTKVDEPPWIYRSVNSKDIDRIIVQLEPVMGGSAGLAEFRYE